MEVARFFTVAVTGLTLDLAVAWSAATIYQLPLWLAAATGFFIAAIVSYVLHEVWTFRLAMGRLSAARALRYSFALGITLATRGGAVAALAMIFGDHQALVVLTAGAAVSFCVHYLVSKHLVFSVRQK